MKLIIPSILLVSLLLLSGCAGDRTINGNTYPAYGLANEDVRKDPKVTYEISAGSVVVPSFSVKPSWFQSM